MLGEILAGADEVVRAAGSDPRRRAHDPRRRAEVRPCRRRHRAPRRDLAEERRPPGRRAVPDQAARHGARAPGAAGRDGSGRRARRRRRGDAHAQPRRGGCAAAVQPERRHRRDGLRPARARVRDGLAERRPARARCRRASRPARRRSSSPRPASAPGAIAATATTRARTSRAPPTDAHEALAFDPQTAGGLLVSLPADKAAVLAATFAAAGLDLFRVGPCVEGVGRRAPVATLQLAPAGSPYTRRMRARARSTWGYLVSPRGFMQLAAAATRGDVLRHHLGCVRPADRRRGSAARTGRAAGRRPSRPQGNQHAIIEFGNRMVALVGIALALVTWLASRKVPGLSAPRSQRSRSAPLLGALAQIPLGGVTIILDLHPLAVMSHFLLALIVLALSVVVALEAWGGVAGRAAALRPAWVRHVVVWAGLPLAAALVVTGAVSTASGPHPGSEEGIERLGRVDRRHRLRPRARGGGLRHRVPPARRRSSGATAPSFPGVVRIWGAALAVLVAQMILGRDPVPQRAAVGARPRPRLPRRDDLVALGGDRVRALAAAGRARPAPERVPAPAVTVGHPVRE